jgi:hypothetical protein
MTVDAWLEAALADADARGLPELKPLLEGLARMTRVLRAADWAPDASGTRVPESQSPAPHRSV